MSVTTTKTRHSSQIALARFANDLERLQLQQLFQLLQQKKESLPQRKRPSSIPIQEKRGCRDAGIPGAMFPKISMKLFHFHVHIDHCDSASQRRDRAEGAKSACESVGILKVAKSLGIGTGTVQRISKERAMSLRGAQQ